MPDDERKGRRLGDETKHRIADLAAGWTVDEPPAAPDPAVRADAPRRKAKTVPPPPPGSAARKALEDKIVEIARDDAAPRSKSPSPPPIPAGGRRAPREGDILGPVAHEASGATRNNSSSDARGAKNDKSGSSINANSASGVIGGTPAPVFDRAAIAAQRKALAEKAASKSGSVPALADKSGAVPALFDKAGTSGPAAQRDDHKSGPTPGLFDRAGKSSAIPALRDDRNSGPTPASRDDRNSGPPPGLFDRAGKSGAMPALRDDRNSGPTPASRDDRNSGPTPASRDDRNSGPSPALRDDRKSAPTPAIVERSGAIGRDRNSGTTPALRDDRKSGATPALRDDRNSGGTAALRDDRNSGGTAALRDDRNSGGTAALRDDRKSGPTPAIVERSGAIGGERKTGPAPAIGGARSPLPPPRAPAGSPPRGAASAGKSGSSPAITDMLPLRADATPVAGAQPPPLPPPPVIAAARPAAPRPVVVDDQVLETIPELGPPPGMPPPPPVKLAVPVGEFDQGQTMLEQDKLRIAHAQSTMKRDAANALLGLAEPEETIVNPPPVETLLEEQAQRVRNDKTAADSTVSETSPFERGDPTIGERPDATVLSPPGSASASGVGTLRTTAALRRKRGIAGDVTYIATVVFGVRRARRELEQLEARQATRQTSRRHHLVTLGRTAVTSEGFDHPALGPAREQLSAVEDQRSQHAGQVLAADTELQRCRTDREAKAKAYKETIAALDAELVTLAKKLEPLEKEAAAVKKRVGDLRDSLRRIDSKITATEASLVSVKGEKLDRAAVQAEIVALRADRRAVAADEPKLAGELDALMPRIAGIEAARAEAQKKRADLEQSEIEDQRRIDELLTAIGAKRKVVDRAAAEAEVLRDKILFELGERLYVDRLRNLTAQLAPIDEIDVELGEADRRVMELKEILSSVDKAKVARGLAVIILALGAVGALVGWLVYMLL